jgi:thiol-disulfide isomerase/thioredoxin
MMRPVSHILWSRAARLGRHAALAAALAGVAIGCRVETAAKPAQPAAVAAPAPVTSDELAQRIQEAKGKPLVVNFWATWCPPCVDEMPQLAQFYNDYTKQGVSFISVSADDIGELKSGKIEAFAREHKLPFPVLVLDGGDPETISRTLGLDVGSLPVTLVYDATGRIVKKWETGITSKELADAVTPLLPKT